MKLAALAATGLAFALPAAAANAPASAPPADQCTHISPSVARDCIGRRVDRKQRQLTALYPQALARVRDGYAKWGSHDNRMHPRFFEQAHKDWRRFVESNCTVTAAFGGGSNSSISDRYTHCYEQEIDRRIALFRHMADGSYGK